MAASAADTGFGMTITFSSGFFAKIRVVSWNNMSRAAIDTSHAGTSNGEMTFIPSDLVDPGGLQIEGLFDHNTEFPTGSAAETVTVTFPLASGEASAATWVASGFLTDASFSAPYDGVVTFSATLKFSGAITVTAAT